MTLVGDEKNPIEAPGASSPSLKRDRRTSLPYPYQPVIPATLYRIQRRANDHRLTLKEWISSPLSRHYQGLGKTLLVEGFFLLTGSGLLT
jgi:hypothetical protein